MSWESKPVINLGTAAAAPDNTIRELISNLRSAFRPMEFDEVERILMDREENLKKSLRKMSIAADLMEKKHCDLALVKLEIEDELNKHKRECDELKERVIRFNEDQILYLDREKKAEERYAKLLQDFTKAENDQKQVILQLNGENRDLKLAKCRAEADVDAWKRKFGELEVRVSRLEEDTAALMTGDPLLNRNIKQESGAEPPVSDEMMVKKEICGLQEADPLSSPMACGNGGVIRKQLVFEPGKSDKIMASPMTESGRPRVREIIEIEDSDEERPMPVSVSVADEMMVKKEICGLQEADPHSSDMACGNGGAIRKQLVFEPVRSDKIMASPMAESWRPRVREIIEFKDSSKESPVRDLTTSVSNLCPFNHILSEKEMTSQKFSKTSYSGLTCEDNGRSCTENSPLASMPKRKRGEGDSDDDNDNNTPIERRKMKHLQEWGCGSKASAIYPRLTTPDLYGTDVLHSVPLSTHEPFFIRHSEEKPEARHNSQIPVSNSDSDDSSDSDDENDLDSFVDKMVANFRRTREKKVWEHKADMLVAFERDRELCMNAVCTLYRQRTSKEHSVKDNVSFNIRELNQFDALRLTALSEFLIDGDPQGKMRKSVSELLEYDPKALDECKKLANRYFDQLFEIYQKKADPFFLPP